MLLSNRHILLLPLSLVVLIFTVAVVHVSGLSEVDRVAEYHKRNYTWPLQHFVPDTPGWRRLNEHRFRQIAEIRDPGNRYEGYMQTINMALVAPNFTEYGFGMVRAPDELMEDLRQGIRDGLRNGPRTEHDIEVIETVQPSWFIDRPDLTQRVLKELQLYPETWANTELTPWGGASSRPRMICQA